MLGAWLWMQRVEYDWPVSTLIHRLRQALSTALAPEIGEVLLPILTPVLTENVVHLRVPNALWATAAQQFALPAIELWLAHEGEGAGLTAMVVDTDATPTEAAAVSNRARTFETFLEDPGNQIALASCRRVVEQPGLEHNPLFLHGPAGCGKTHLLRAVVHEYRIMLGDESALWIDGPEFVASGAQDLARRTFVAGENDGLRGQLEQAAVIVLDNIDALSGRDLAQEELFHVMNAALDRGAQLLFAGRQAPRKLSGFTDRLTSRLAWGLTVGLDLPHLETRVALVRRVAGSALTGSDATALTALVEAQAPDMTQALSLADRLSRGGVDLNVAVPATQASFERIVQAVADRFELRPSDLASKRRHAEIVQARGLALLLGRRLTNYSLDALGGMVGGRDHTTVMHAVRSTEARVAADPELQRAISELTRLVLTPQKRY